MNTKHTPQIVDFNDPKKAIRSLKGSIDDAFLLLNRFENSINTLKSKASLTPTPLSATQSSNINSFSMITSKPITLAGYGITDAVSSSALSGTQYTVPLWGAGNTLGNSIITQAADASALTVNPITASGDLIIGGDLSNNLFMNYDSAFTDWLFKAGSTECFRLSGVDQSLTMYGANKIKLRSANNYIQSDYDFYIKYYSQFHNFYAGGCGTSVPTVTIGIGGSQPNYPLYIGSDASNNLVLNYADTATSLVFLMGGALSTSQVEVCRMSYDGSLTMALANKIKFRDSDFYIQSSSAGVGKYLTKVEHDFWAGDCGGQLTFKITPASIGIYNITSTKTTYFTTQSQSGDIIYTLPAASTTGYLLNTSGTWSWVTTATPSAHAIDSATYHTIGALTNLRVPCASTAGPILADTCLYMSSDFSKVGIGATPTTYALEINQSSGACLWTISPTTTMFNKITCSLGDAYWGISSSNLFFQAIPNQYLTMIGSVSGNGVVVGPTGCVGIQQLPTTSYVPLQILPSTTNSSLSIRGIEIQGYALNNEWIGENCYYNGGFVHRDAGTANYIYFVNGSIYFGTAPTGAAGTACTFSNQLQVSPTGVTINQLTPAGIMTNTAAGVIGTYVGTQYYLPRWTTTGFADSILQQNTAGTYVGVNRTPVYGPFEVLRLTTVGVVGWFGTNTSATYSDSAPNGSILFESSYTGQGGTVWDTARIKWGYADTYGNSGARFAVDTINSAGNWINSLLISASGTGAGTITLPNLSSAGVVHNSAAGLLSTSAVVQADLGAIGTSGTVPLFAATGFSDSIIKQTSSKIGINCTASYLLDVQSTTDSPTLRVMTTVSPTGTSIGGFLILGLNGGTAKYTGAGDYPGYFQYIGQGNDAAYEAAAIKCIVTTGGNVTRANQEAKLVISTKKLGGVGSVDALTIGGDSSVTVTGAFGCNGKAAQTAYTVNAACTDLPTAVALLNQIRAAVIANGICV